MAILLVPIILHAYEVTESPVLEKNIEDDTSIVFEIKTQPEPFWGLSEHVAGTTQSFDKAVEVAREEIKKKEEEKRKERRGDSGVLWRICTCESGMGTGRPQHYDRDGSVLRGRVDSRDTGMCQINKGYHGEAATRLGYDLETEDGNWGYAMYLFRQQGTQPWKASEYCWNK